MNLYLPISVEYDDIGDVLYIVAADPHDTRNIEETAGLVLRYDSKTRDPVGATVLDYKEYWGARQDELVNRLSMFFHMSKSDTERALREAQ